MLRVSGNVVVFVSALVVGMISVFLFGLLEWQSEISADLTSESFAEVEGATSSQVDKKRPRFFAAGIEDDREILDLFDNFQQAVRHRDKKAAASLMTFPLIVSFPGDDNKRDYTLIRNSKAFIAAYDRIFHKKLTEFILQVDSSDPQQIWSISEGTAVGRGVIWIGTNCVKDDCKQHYSLIRTIHSDSNLLPN